jgi:hypothetical protein
MPNVKKIETNILTVPAPMIAPDEYQDVEIHMRVRGSIQNGIRLDIGGSRKSLMQKLGSGLKKLWGLLT